MGSLEALPRLEAASRHYFHCLGLGLGGNCLGLGLGLGTCCLGLVPCRGTRPRHLCAIAKLDKGLSTELCKQTSNTQLTLTLRELQQLKGLVGILEPFAGSTDIAQG